MTNTHDEVYGTNFEGCANMKDDLADWFLEIMETAQPKYGLGFYYKRMMELNGFTENTVPSYNLQPGDTYEMLFDRICEKEKNDILENGAALTEKGREFIKNAPNGYKKV